MNCQGQSIKIFLEEQSVRYHITPTGDTLAVMSLPSARKMLKVVLEGRICDSIALKYEEIDSVKGNIMKAQRVTISSLFKQIENLKEVANNVDIIVGNLHLVTNAQKKDIELLLKEQKKLKKEIKRQILFKRLALGGIVLVGVLVVI